MGTNEIFLLAMVAILLIPYLVWRLSNLDYYVPLVVVQIVCGILLGPGVLGAKFPDAYNFVFNKQVLGALNGIAAWAVMIFVWLGGIELNLKLVWVNRRESSITAAFALLTPLLFGCGIASILLLFKGWAGEQAQGWQFILGIGMGAAVTALPILILLMEKMEILRSPIGQRILRYASLDDVAIWGVLALILMDWQRLGLQALFFGAYIVAAVLIRRLMAWLAPKDRWYVGLIWLAVCGFGADWAGLHYMVGAFLAGVVLDAEWFEQEHLDRFREQILLTAMPVFFLSTGLRTNWQIGGSQVFLVAGILLVGSISGKYLGARIAGKVLKWAPGEASLIGWLLQTKALIEIVFVTVLLDKGIITGAMFTAMLLMALGSTVLTVPVVVPKLKRLAGLIYKEA